MNVNRTVVAPLSSAIIALMLAGGIVVGIDQIEPKLKEGEVRLNTKGIIEVSIAGGPWVRAARSRVLRPNDRVNVLSGTASLELLRGKAGADLRQGSMVMVPTDTTADLILQQGELLVDAESQKVDVEGGVALVSVAGAAKLRRSESLATGVYKGNVYLFKDGASLPVHQYRQAAAAGTGVLPANSDPLSLDPDDDWDRRMLPEVLDLDAKLAQFGRDFEAALPGDRAKDPSLFGLAIPDLASAPLSAILDGPRAAGENAIGLTLMSLDTGSFSERYDNIFGFRADGARWGLVAADRNLNPNPVIGGFEQALGRLEVALAPPGSIGKGLTGKGGTGGRSQIGGAIGPLPAGGTGTGTTPAGVGGGSGTQPGGSGGTDPGTTPPSTQPPSTQPPGTKPKRVDVPPVGLGLDPILEPIVDPLENLLSGLLDGLLGPSQGTTSGTTGSGPTSTGIIPTGSTTPTTTAPAAVATTTTTVPASTPTTVMPAAATPTSTTTTTSGGLLGGLINGLGGTLGGVL